MTQTLAPSTELANLIASRFIQRRGPVAVQMPDGGYRPWRQQQADGSYTQQNFNRALLDGHLGGVNTYGHYLLDENSMCKLFVVDIDLIPTPGFLPTTLMPDAPTEQDIAAWEASFVQVTDLRAAWHDRRNLPARQYLKRQMRQLSAIFTSHISQYIQIDTAAAYSGNKGIHVYGFTGPVAASTAREYAELLMSIPGWLAPFRGDSFYADTRDASVEHYHNWHFEIYPKQATLDGKDLGNLIRLPLGTNRHNPQDPTFFIDLTAPLNTLKPVNPVHALKPGNAWLRENELPSAN